LFKHKFYSLLCSYKFAIFPNIFVFTFLQSILAHACEGCWDNSSRLSHHTSVTYSESTQRPGAKHIFAPPPIKTAKYEVKNRPKSVEEAKAEHLLFVTSVVIF